jgi:hypothetical protein
MCRECSNLGKRKRRAANALMRYWIEEGLWPSLLTLPEVAAVVTEVIPPL